MSQHQSRQLAEPSWQWPVSTKNYDQDPVLHEQERLKLKQLLQRKSTSHVSWYQETATDPDLCRLFRPIHDVLTLTQAPKFIGYSTICLCAQLMYQRGSSLWAWSQNDWLEILATSAQAFNERHGTGVDECRQQMMAVVYLFRNFTAFNALGECNQTNLARKVFGRERIDTALCRVQTELHQWGYQSQNETINLRKALCAALLRNRSPFLEDLSTGILATLYEESHASYLKANVFRLARALAHMGLIDKPLPYSRWPEERVKSTAILADVPSLWAQWAQRWHDTSTLVPQTRDRRYYGLLKVGRWLAAFHPDVTTPEQWTRELAAEYVAAVLQMEIGQWSRAGVMKMYTEKIGKPYSPRAKEHQLALLRTFFEDCQEWGWIPRRFDPRRSLATPRSVRALIAPNPRVIADDIWAKLLWAGLNLQEEDLPASMYHKGTPRNQKVSWYPLEMVRAMVLVWLFAGLRADEFRRLRLGCIRWQREDVTLLETEEVLPRKAVCWLDVPAHKTGTPFTKAVDAVVGEAVEAWERVRPPQPPFVDQKTGESVQYLFAYRGNQVGEPYLNEALIPMLCRKAGVPEADARGDITSHRARSTIASQLYNAKEPLSLFDLQEWLGHRLLSSTQSYAKKSPTKVAKAYEKAGYFAQNMRMIEVLIDQEAVKSGAAASGEPWRFYDLGHGYCTYEFFDQCPHRMACAKCAFYRPKGSSQAQMLEAQANLLRLKQEIPLSQEEEAAVDDGIEALEHLYAKLADVPTPAGPTPRQLSARESEEHFIPLSTVRR